MNLSDIIDPLKLPFQQDKELRRSLRQIIGFYPHNIEHYKIALTHKSSGQRTGNGKPLNNERLEFLGDALLDAVVGHIVFDHFSGKREGFLTNTRSKLVSRDTLGKLAAEMGLTDLIQSSAQQRSHNSYIAGNAFEALVGAIYLDQGYDAVMRFMEKRILKQMVNIDKVAYKEVNFKSKLLEWTQKNRVRMEFRMLKQTADEKGSPVFGFQVMIEGVEGGKGQGYSKKEAQQKSASETLLRLRREPQFIDAIFQAKSNRTKMEEEPTAVAPDLEAEKTNFIVSQDRTAERPAAKAKAPQQREAKPQAADDKPGKREAKPQKADDKPQQREAKPQAAADKPGKREAKPQKADDKPQRDAAKPRRDSAKGQAAEGKGKAGEADEFDLSDITHNPVDPSREDIIAAAEAAAFAE